MDKKLDFKKAEDWAVKNYKPILIVGGIIAGILIVKKLFPGLFSKNLSIEDMPIDTSKLTITQVQATQIATNLYEAMNGLGTDEQTLFDSITPLNGEDLNLVVKTFGTPKYFLTGGDAYLGTKLSLQGWLKAELGGTYYDEMKALFDARNVPF
jgi:hypothetical protein